MIKIQQKTIKGVKSFFAWEWIKTYVDRGIHLNNILITPLTDENTRTSKVLSQNNLQCRSQTWVRVFKYF